MSHILARTNAKVNRRLIMIFIFIFAADVPWHVAPVVGALAAPTRHEIPLRARSMQIVRPGSTGEAGQARQVGTLQGYAEDLLVEGAIPATLSRVEASSAVRQTDR